MLGKLFKCAAVALFKRPRRTEFVEEPAFFRAFTEGFRTQHYCCNSSMLRERHGIFNFERAEFAKGCSRDLVDCKNAPSRSKLSSQRLRYDSTQLPTSFSGATSIRHGLVCAARLREIRPAPSSTFRCFEIEGWVRSNGSASSLTVASPEASRAMMARRVGSASAANALFRLSGDIAVPFSYITILEYK